MNNRTAIVQVVQHLAPGGIETLALDLTRMPPGQRPAYIVSLEGRKPDMISRWPTLEPFADRIVFLDKPQGWSPATLFKLMRVLRQIAPQAVHTHHTGPMLYGGLAARLTNVPKLIHTEHDAWHLENAKRRTLVRTLAGLLRPVVVADANIVGNIFQNRTGRPVARVIRNGIDTERFRPGNRWQARRIFDLPLDAKIIGVAGRLEPVKGQDIALKAFAAMKDRQAFLAVAGDGSLRETLESLARDLGVFKNVRFLGRVDQMPQFYQALDLLCLPSRREGLPLSVLEAQACGCPVVATDVGGVCEAVCPDTGDLVAPEFPPALASALTRRLKNLAGNPREFAQRIGDRNVMAAQYAELIS